VSLFSTDPVKAKGSPSMQHANLWSSPPLSTFSRMNMFVNRYRRCRGRSSWANTARPRYPSGSSLAPSILSCRCKRPQASSIRARCSSDEDNPLWTQFQQSKCYFYVDGDAGPPQIAALLRDNDIPLMPSRKCNPMAGKGNALLKVSSEKTLN